MPTVPIVRSIRTVAAALSLAVLVAAATPDHAPVALEVRSRSNSTPWVAAAGSFVAAAWGATADGRADVFVAVSRDGGRSFGPPVQVNLVPGEARLGGEFPPRVLLAPAAREAVPEIVVLWVARGTTTEIRTARSRDGGTSFEKPTTLQSSGAAGDRGWPALALDARGAAHAIWLDHRGLAARRSSGASGADPHGGAAHDGATTAQGSALYYASTGGTAAGERSIAESVCYCCKTALAAGPGGTLFAAWRHVYPGNLRDIAMAVARDGGQSFSPPARVSEDGWSINGCPDDGPSIAADEGGTVHIVWPTVIPGQEPEGALFYASTRDGQHFTPRLRIPTLGSRKPSHPQIVAAATGRIVVAWDESISGRRVAAMREVRLRPGGDRAFGEVVTIAPAGAAEHPVVAATGDGFVVVWSTGGSPSRVFSRVVRLP
jgi:hypothetical protein